MGRPSKLTEKQWAEVGARLLKGEKPAALAKEFKVDRSALTRRFSHELNTVKAVANQLVAADVALKALPVAQQVQAVTLADELRAISMHMAGAAKFGSATAHRLSGIAHANVQKIDDASPLDAESMENLKGVAVLTKMANDAAVIPTALMMANKETIKDLNSGAAQSKDELLREIAGLLPN